MANEQDKLGIILETSSDGSGFDDTQQGFKETERVGTESAENIEQSYTEALTTIRNVSAVAFAAVGAGIGFAAREAAQAELGMASYRAAVKNAGGDSNVLAEQLNNTAASLQRLTGIADDDFINAATRMTDVTGDAEGALENLNLVADLSAARNIDMAMAGDMVARAMEGEIGMLGRLLPGLGDQVAALGENADKADVAAVIFERLAQFQGRAAEKADTTTGRFNILKEELAQSTETIGNAFLPAINSIYTALTPIVQGIGDWAEEHSGLVAVIGGGALAVSGFLAVATTIGTVAPLAATGLATMNVALAGTRALLLTIPGWGWATAGALAIGALTLAIVDFEAEAEDTPDVVRSIKEAFDEFTPAVSDATAVVTDFSHVTAEELEKAAEDNIIPGLNNVLDTVEIVASRLTSLSATPLKPLDLSISEDFSFDTTDFDQTAMQDAHAASYELMVADTEDSSRRIQEVWQRNRDSFLYHTGFLQNTYRAAIGTFADTEMTGKERREAIWGQFRTSVVGYIADVTAKYIFGEAAKRAASVATATIGVAASSTAAVAEVGNANKVTASWMAAAFAKLVAFYGFAGPLAPVLAVGTIGAAIAGIGAIIASTLGAVKMQEGGIVPGVGSGDRTPAMLEPGERVIAKDEYMANRGAIENAIAGGSGGSGNIFHFHLDKSASTDDFLRLRQMLEQWIVPVIEQKQREGAFTMRGVPA